MKELKIIIAVAILNFK